MTDVDFKNALLAGDEEEEQGEETRDIPTKTGVITVRGMSRAEVLSLNGKRDRGAITLVEWEAKVVALCIVSPVLTEAEVVAWQKVSRVNGTAGRVSDAIMVLSGLADGADKSGVAEAGDE